MGEEKPRQVADFIESMGPVSKEEAHVHLIQSLVALQSAFLEGDIGLGEFSKNSEFQALMAGMMGIVVSIPTGNGLLTTTKVCYGCMYARYTELFVELVGPLPFETLRVPHSH